MGITLFLLTSIALFSIPIVMQLLRGQPEKMLEIFVPGIDDTTKSGFLVVSAYHTVLIIMSFLGTCGYDLIFISLVIHYWPLVAIFDIEVKDFNKTLKEVNSKTKIQLQFRNILLMHKEIIW